MERIPEDPEARRAWLEGWVAQQQRKRQPQQRDEIRMTPAMAVELLVDRLDRQIERIFDRRLDTTTRVYDVPETGPVDGVAYVPSAWHVLPRALRAVGAGKDDVFVDFGCGKGRIVHQAARWPLRKVIGVEVSPALAEQARGLVAANRHRYRCRDVEIVIADAARFQVPDDVTIAYFFDPFRGRTLDAVIQNMVDSVDRRPRRLRLIYVNPTFGAQVLAGGRFRLVKWQRGGLRDVRVSRAAIFEAGPSSLRRRG